MPAVLIGIGLYIGACYAAIRWIIIPALPYIVVGGAIAGVLLVLAATVGTLLGVGRFAAATVGPQHAPERLPGTGTPYPRDAAWPNYLFAQSRTDLRAAAAEAARLVASMWARPVNWVRDEPGVLWSGPLLLLPVVFLVVATAGALAAAAAFALLFSSALLTTLLVLLVAVGVLRGLDYGIRRMRRAKVTCHRGDCSHRGMLPAYRCVCGVVHHDIRAGYQGVFLRRCRCDRQLPTTVLKASSGLVAVCQGCGRDLRPGAGVLTDVRVPVFGPTSAGKSRLIMAGIVALARHQTATGGTFAAVGQESEATFAYAGAIVASGQQTDKTAGDRLPDGITVRLGTARRKAHLQLHDAAGEFFATREQNQEVPFLASADGFIFVLDPFSIPAVADDLRGELKPRLAEAQAALMPPEPAYLVTVQWLRDQHVDLARKPLAVAVVKADVLLDLPPGADLTADVGSAALADWLRTKGLENLLDGAERDFAQIRYFLVSSLTDITTAQGRAARTSPARPLLWLLGRSGVDVVEEKETAIS